MDNTEDDSRYTSKHYSVNHHSTYTTSLRSKRPSRNQSYPINTSYNEYEDDELDEENEEGNQEFDDQEDDEIEYQNGYRRVIQPNDEPDRRQKKRRLENLVSKYEFAPRAGVNLPKPSFVARDSPAEWTEHATFVLLEVWGERFEQLGWKSLRSDDWIEVAEKVSEMCKLERTDMQCRNRLDTLKKKYKKEKAKIEEMSGYHCKWTFFKKMDRLLNSSPREQCGLPCGVDSGEYVFMNPTVYLNQSNALDEMRDSPGESESDGDDLDGLKSKRKGFGGEEDDGSSFRLLADSVQKFGAIYEKIEISKRQQMMELEKMRMDFQKDLELQKKKILERAQAEIAKIRQGDDEDTDVSAENLSG